MKTGKNRREIRLYLQKCEIAKTSDIAELLGLSMARTRAILSEMDDVRRWEQIEQEGIGCERKTSKGMLEIVGDGLKSRGD